MSGLCETASGTALPSLATFSAERAPTLARPRKQEREWTVRGVSSFRHMDTNTPSEQSVGLPLPLAGEGWGGGVSASEVSMADENSPTWKVSSRLRSNARALRK